MDNIQTNSLKAQLKNAYKDAAELIDNYYQQEEVIANTEKFAQVMAESFNKGGKGIIFGNGGSTCDALHFSEEFTGRYRKNRRPLPVIAIAESSHLTCVANDFGFEEVFNRGVQAFAKPEDIVIGISTSGNSENVIRALNSAKEIGAITVGVLGKDGGNLAGKTDIEFIVPGKTADRIQEVHMTILHIVIEGIERLLFPEQYN